MQVWVLSKSSWVRPENVLGMSRINLPGTSLERQIKTSTGRQFRTSPGRNVPGMSDREVPGTVKQDLWGTSCGCWRERSVIICVLKTLYTIHMKTAVSGSLFNQPASFLIKDSEIDAFLWVLRNCRGHRFYKNTLRLLILYLWNISVTIT